MQNSLSSILKLRSVACQFHPPHNLLDAVSNMCHEHNVLYKRRIQI